MNAPIALAVCLTVLTAVMLVHDVVPLGRWNNLGQRVPRPVGVVVRHTVLNTVTGLVPTVLAWRSLGAHGFATARLVILVVVCMLLLGAFSSWWLPWMRGTGPERTRELAAMTDGTLSFVPERNGIMPNAIHSVIHLLALASFVLVIAASRS